MFMHAVFETDPVRSDSAAGSCCKEGGFEIVTSSWYFSVHAVVNDVCEWWLAKIFLPDCVRCRGLMVARSNSEDSASMPLLIMAVCARASLDRNGVKND